MSIDQRLTIITNRNFQSVNFSDEIEFSQRTPLSSRPERRPISITAEKLAVRGSNGFLGMFPMFSFTSRFCAESAAETTDDPVMNYMAARLGTQFPRGKTKITKKKYVAHPDSDFLSLRNPRHMNLHCDHLPFCEHTDDVTSVWSTRRLHFWLHLQRGKRVCFSW